MKKIGLINKDLKRIIITTLSQSEFAKEGGRFVIAGITSTLLTITLYQICLFFFSPLISCTLSWIIGISMMILVYPAYIFKKKSSTISEKLAIISWYLIIFIISASLINLFIYFKINSRVAIFISLIFATPINFLGLRFILKR